jgi:hypothetical protein
MTLHRWSLETMLAGLFGDLYFDGDVKSFVQVPRLIYNVQVSRL